MCKDAYVGVRAAARAAGGASQAQAPGCLLAVGHLVLGTPCHRGHPARRSLQPSAGCESPRHAGQGAWQGGFSGWGHALSGLSPHQVPEIALEVSRARRRARMSGRMDMPQAAGSPARTGNQRPAQGLPPSPGSKLGRSQLSLLLSEASCPLPCPAGAEAEPGSSGPSACNSPLPPSPWPRGRGGFRGTCEALTPLPPDLPTLHRDL